MIRTLGNISIRLWLCALIGMPLSLVFISLITNTFQGFPVFYMGILLNICLFWILGFIMNSIGKSLITMAVREGEAWERSGILIKSEQSYLKALRIYDSFLLSSSGFKKITPRLIHALTKFILISKRNHPNFMNAATVYLKNNPSDEDMALLWLKRMSQENKMNGIQEDVLSRIAQIHKDSPRILPLLTRFFIGMNRMDFPAQKIYQSALEDVALKPHFESRINNLISTNEDDNILASGRPLLSFEPRQKQKKDTVNITMALIKKYHALMSFLKTLIGILTSGISFLILFFCSLFTWIRQKDSAKFYLKAGMLAATCILLIILAVNTITHLTPSPDSPPEKQAVDIQVPKPFTIQVAAYLKKVHADQYVERLKKKGLAAESKKVTGGGKEWFLVTISEFPDKSSAAQYGTQLKNRRVIEDFFVTNKL